MSKIAIIIGAGPAGLTAAHELLARTAITPVVFEMSGDIGGISKTVNYRGNRIDLGGHRFFSKSDRVMQWWLDVFPLQATPAPDPEQVDAVMLLRQRLSRILFLRKFFDYPVSLSGNTVRNLGLWRLWKIFWSYLAVRVHPVQPEQTLEDFLTNRFGRELYRTFFKDYTEKVWGVPCDAIKPEWGAQRIKGLSITRAILHALGKLLPRRRTLAQKNTETSLIEQFMYPKLGPGQLWEAVATRIVDRGGEVHRHHRVIGLQLRDGQVCGVTVRNEQTGETFSRPADYVFSTMPIRELLPACTPPPPAAVLEVGNGLLYRDFMTVGLLVSRMRVPQAGNANATIVPDNWIYIQERDVKLGRVQVFNNWSPYLVADQRQVWLGLEYFCSEGDHLWTMDDDAFARFAIAEVEKIGLIDGKDVLDATVLRMPKAYPAYFGTYDRMPEIRAWVDTIPNLFLIGRNGMHRYNNADHSMLTAMIAVDNLVQGHTDKTNIWAVNTEEEYHESK